MGPRFGKFCAIIAFAIVAAPLAQAASYPAPRLKPPAPGPQYLTRLDAARLLSVAGALELKQFDRALVEISGVEDPTARSLGAWMYHLAGDPRADYLAGDAFLDAHPQWPAVDRIQRSLEDNIPDTAPADAVLAFFDGRPPLTGDGKISYARALAAGGRASEADAAARDAWINHNFSAADERAILAEFGARLSPADHAERVDRMLWDRQVTNARRAFPLLAADERRKAEARAALLLGASTGPRLYRELSEEAQLDSGVLQAAVRYFRRDGDEQYAASLAGEAPTDPSLLRNDRRWWIERRLLIRWALAEGRFAEAYALAARHGMADGADYADAEFAAGWIALRFLKEPARAEQHFKALAAGVGTPISLSRAYYWLGRSAAAQNDETAALNYYGSAAQHQYSYYGQLAAEELGDAAPLLKFEAAEPPTEADRALFASRPSVRALQMLSDLGLDYEFTVFAYHVDGLLEEPGEYRALAELTNGEGAPHLTVRAGKIATQRDAFAAEVAYPLIYVPQEARAFVPAELVLGLSRQESEFNPRAFSSAGARGVMQLLPSTAQLTARKERLPYIRSALLDDPHYNMTIGSAHLSHLLERFDGSLIMTLAGYNAGAHRVSQWIEEFGDPRTDAVDPVDWVELIPFSETRNYVQRVLENMQVYRGRLEDAPIAGRLSADLEAGGPRGRIANAPPSARLFANAAAFPAPRLIDAPARTMRIAEKFAAAAPALENDLARASPAPQTPKNAAPRAIVPAETASNSSSGVAAAPSRAEAASRPAPFSAAPAAAAPSAAASQDFSPAEAAPADPIDAPANAPTPDPVAFDTAPPVAARGDADASTTPDSCLTYRAFLAENAEEEETAAEDLNAGMLAELSSGAQPSC